VLKQETLLRASSSTYCNSQSHFNYHFRKHVFSLCDTPSSVSNLAIFLFAPAPRPRLGFDARNSEPPSFPHSPPRTNAVVAIDPSEQRPDWGLCTSSLSNLWRIATSPFATLPQSILWHFLPMIVAYLGRLLSAPIRCCESSCVEHCAEHGEFLCFNTANASPPT
jgi:hypothetical protein